LTAAVADAVSTQSGCQCWADSENVTAPCERASASVRRTCMHMRESLTRTQCQTLAGAVLRCRHLGPPDRQHERAARVSPSVCCECFPLCVVTLDCELLHWKQRSRRH
jgi:hypothetical protein